MFKKSLAGMFLLNVLSASAFADVGFDADTAGWVLNQTQSTLTSRTDVPVAVSDVYSIDYPNVMYATQLSPRIGTGFGYLVMPDSASMGALATDTAIATYTFTSVTTGSNTLWVRLVTADGAYYDPLGANDGFTVTLTGSYGVRTYSVALESAAGGGVNATHISGDRSESLAGADQNGFDTGWLSFGVLAGTSSIGLSVTNVYDDAGHNAPVVAVDYGQASAVPEPGTLALMWAGLAVATAAIRRRQSRFYL